MAASQTDDLVQAIITEAARLQDFLTSLDAQTWAIDSTSEGWTIEDVVAHLAGSAGGWATNITRAVAGDAGPPEGQSFLPAGVRASHPTGPAARESRQKSGPQILDDFIAGHERLRNVLGNLRDEDWDKPCFHRRGVRPIKDYLGIQLQELALHGWDIRWGLDGAAELWPGSLAALVDLVPRWIGTAFAPGLDLPIPVRYRFAVSSPVAIHEDLVVYGDGYKTETSDTEDADATFHGNTGNYILLMFGRLQVERAAADGRLSVDGSMERAKDFNAWFKGF
ncbi:uncharacterized protein METZ01_LOCUS130896 [marine metagenome]|uniref:Mycothiol-dependent maleylpyruvate isomerase metal-binding domain-containing protein n=1 Tax=marine metagenome TaxID=408172 RepID=A0A381YN63_9ZZZZ